MVPPPGLEAERPFSLSPSRNSDQPHSLQYASKIISHQHPNHFSINMNQISSTLKMEAACSSVMFMLAYNTARCQNSKIQSEQTIINNMVVTSCITVKVGLRQKLLRISSFCFHATSSSSFYGPVGISSGRTTALGLLC